MYVYMECISKRQTVADLEGRGLLRPLDRSTVKHALPNTQNDCHQWLSLSFRVHQIRFRLDL